MTEFNFIFKISHSSSGISDLQFEIANRKSPGRFGRCTFAFPRPPAFAPVATLPAAAKGRPSPVTTLMRFFG
jgi:hypothetical protein